MKKGMPVEETFWMGALLALSGGILDAYTYLARGGVFAFAQTGNLVLLGIRIARREYAEICCYLIPVLAFTGGVLLTEAIRHRFREHPRFAWRQAALAAEAAILAAVAFFPAGGGADTAANVAVSLACGIQVESFRKMVGAAYATTMCTGNLRSAAELLFRFWITKDPEERRQSLRFYGVVGIFLGGAVLGEWMVRLFRQRAVLVCLIPLAAAIGLLFLRVEKAEKSSGKK